ncbi:hypothetical protein ACHAXR_011496 [Thalassiosira sp. AJA248-18]
MARNSLALLLVSLILQPKAALGFLPPWMPGVQLTSAPELTRYTRGQTDTVLEHVRLSIGLTADQQFVIDGFQFQLCNEPIAKDDSAVPLPGANGPRPHLSSGAHQMRFIKDGSFINMEGLQTVPFRDGVWEMIWRDESPAGLIICGFHLDEDARRNDALLEKGQVFLTWPVWSKDGLEKHQARKAEAESRYKEYETERDTELEKMSNAPNILQKALHFRAAAAAMEKMDFTGLHGMLDVPSADDVLEIGEGLQMVKTGTVWTKTGSFSGSFRANRQQLLGSATIHSN